METHTCYVDCEPTPSATGGIAHVMYPADPDRSAGRYQAAQNVGMTRRQWRASGQDQSRACRAWDRARALRLAAFHAAGLSR
jgi:hypothetical protein